MILRGKLTQYGPQNRATLFAPGNPTERHSKTDLVVDYKKSRTIKNCYPFYLVEKKERSHEDRALQLYRIFVIET